MKIKIGELRISSLELDLLWQCSNCGTVNLNKQTITVQVDNQNIHAEEKARKALASIVDELQQDDIVRRYDHADFTCKCDRCYHQEPWAKLYNKIFAYSVTTAIGLLILFVCAAVFAFPSFYKSLMRGETFGLFLLFAILGSAALLVITLLINKIRTNRLHNQISQLPITAIPQIFNHSSTRHHHFFQNRNNAAFLKDFQQQD